MAGRKQSARAMSMPGGIVVGMLSAWAVMLGLAAILAWLVIRESLNYNSIGYGTLIMIPLATMLGSLIAYSRIKHRRLMVAGLMCAAVYGSLILIGMTFGGRMEGFVLHGALVLLGGGISVIPAFSGPGSGGRKHKIHRHG